MDLITIILLLLLLVLIFLTMQRDPEQSRFKNLLDKIPGPPTVPIFGNAWDLLRRPLHKHIEVYRERQKKYGPIFRTWRGFVGEVNINTAEGAEVLLGNPELIDKSFEYMFLEPWLGDSIFLRNGQRWRNIRKTLATGFNSNILHSYHEVFRNNSEIFLQKLKEKADKEPFDICPLIRHFTLDVICETTIGIKVDAQNENNLDYVDAIHYGLLEIVQRHISPWLQWDFIYNLSNTAKKFQEYFDTVHSFIGKIIEDRKRLLDKPQEVEDLPMYDSEVRRKNLDLIGIIGRKLTEKEIREMTDGIIFAGHDTTSCALSWAIQLLADHTHVQEKVFEELESIFHGSDRPPTKDDYQEMKYLECVIKETLRLYPSGPAIARSFKKDIQIGEHLIPAGASIWIQLYFIHRDPKYYPNPEEFNPDNFLPENICNRHPFAYLGFSAGARNCLGQRYAITEMKTLLSYIIRNYKIKSMRKTKELSEVHAMTLTAFEGIYITLTSREGNKNI